MSMAVWYGATERSWGQENLCKKKVGWHMQGHPKPEPGWLQPHSSCWLGSKQQDCCSYSFSKPGNPRLVCCGQHSCPTLLYPTLGNMWHKGSPRTNSSGTRCATVSCSQGNKHPHSWPDMARGCNYM